MPKSSSDKPTPRLLSCCIVAKVPSLSSSSTRSVISSSSRCAGRPDFASAVTTCKREAAVPELDRRQVDGDLDVRAARSPPRRRRGCKTHSPSAMIRPVSSATGMNTDGGTLPRTGMFPAHQRLAGRHPAGAQVDQRLVSSTRTARCRGLRAGRVRARGAPAPPPPSRMAKKQWSPPPPFLAAYSAMSAFFSSSSASTPSVGAMAMPIEAPISMRWPSISNGSLERARPAAAPAARRPAGAPWRSAARRIRRRRNA